MRCGSEYIDIALIEAGIFATEEELRNRILNGLLANPMSSILTGNRARKKDAVVEALEKCDCGDIEFEKTFR